MNDAGSFTITCTPDGRIVDLLDDTLGMGIHVQPGVQFFRMIRHGETAKALHFLQKVHATGRIAHWPLGIVPDELGRDRTLHFTGVCEDGTLRITGTADADPAGGARDETPSPGALQAEAMRAVLHDGPESAALYEEISSLNNELVSAQRELARKNAELREANSQVERARETLREYNLRLERSNRDLADFAHVASHDLQEPLRKVLMFSDLLASEYRDVLGETGMDYMSRMLNATRRMQAMITDLLTIARTTTQVRHPAGIALADVVAEVLADLDTVIAREGAVVHVGALPTIEADATQMRQLLQNLVGNAVKFHGIGQAPQVWIEAEILGDGACRIVVADDGIGFDMQHADRIFKPLQRLVGHSAYEGSGLGLAICKRIAECHGGDITADSAPGRGARFTVMLPATPA